MTKLVDSVQLVPFERVQERIVEQISVVPQTTEKIVSAVQAVPSERIRERLVEQISVVPQTTETNGHVVQPVPLERIQERIVEQISVVSQTTEKVAHCLPDQIVEVPVPLITDKLWMMYLCRIAESVYCVSSF